MRVFWPNNLVHVLNYLTITIRSVVNRRCKTRRKRKQNEYNVLNVILVHYYMISTWNVKFSVYVLNAYGGVDMQLHAFLTRALDAGEWAVGLTIRPQWDIQVLTRGWSGSIPCQSIWDLWWTNWHWNRFRFYMVWGFHSFVNDDWNVLEMTQYWLVICYRRFGGACSCHVEGSARRCFSLWVPLVLHAHIYFIHYWRHTYRNRTCQCR